MRKLFHERLDHTRLVKLRSLKKSEEGFVLDIDIFQKEWSGGETVGANEFRKRRKELPGAGGDIEKFRVIRFRPAAIKSGHPGNGLELFDERISQRGACIMHPGHFDSIIDIRDHDDARIINEMDFGFE